MFVLRRVFIVFSPDVLLCELSGIPFRLDSRNHTAEATAMISESMKRRDIRTAVQILVFY
jgi:hypothetical protein